MESRATLRGTGTSKWITALLALSIVLALSVMAGYLAKPVSSPAATQTNSGTLAAPGAYEPADSFDGNTGFIP